MKTTIQSGKLSALAAVCSTFCVPLSQAQSCTSGQPAGAPAFPPLTQGEATAPVYRANAQVAPVDRSMDRLFMVKASAGNMAEVASSRLALRKSRNPQVRQIAQHMVQDHSRAQQELVKIMRAQSVAGPAVPGVMQQATMEKLQRASGAQFDRLYMAAQVEAHEDTVALYQSAAPLVRDSRTRDYINRNLPGIINHTKMIYTVARAVNAPGSSVRPPAFPVPSTVPARAMAHGTSHAMTVSHTMAPANGTGSVSGHAMKGGEPHGDVPAEGSRPTTNDSNRSNPAGH